MPFPEQDYRFQVAQLWQVRSNKDRYGNPIVYGRESIAVRWEADEIQVIGPNGQPISLDAMAVVLCDIPIGSMMWLGCEDDLPADGIPTSNIMEVITSSSIPDVKNRVSRRKVGLKRYTDKFPAIGDT